MRIRQISLTCALLVSACSPPPNNEVTLETTGGPDLALIQKIEKELSGDPCLREIATMRREYRYRARDGEEIKGLIDVSIQEAGWDDLPGGIFIMGQPEFYSFDSRSYFVAFATYHIENEDLDLWACGDNAAGRNSLRGEPRY